MQTMTKFPVHDHKTSSFPKPSGEKMVQQGWWTKKTRQWSFPAITSALRAELPLMCQHFSQWWAHPDAHGWICLQPPSLPWGLLSRSSRHTPNELVSHRGVQHFAHVQLFNDFINVFIPCLTLHFGQRAAENSVFSFHQSPHYIIILDYIFENGRLRGSIQQNSSSETTGSSYAASISKNEDLSQGRIHSRFHHLTNILQNLLLNGSDHLGRDSSPPLDSKYYENLTQVKQITLHSLRRAQQMKLWHLFLTLEKQKHSLQTSRKHFFSTALPRDEMNLSDRILSGILIYEIARATSFLLWRTTSA